MGPTRKRDLAVAAMAAAAVAYVLIHQIYRWFPPITLWTGLWLLAVAVAEGGWGRYVRSKISAGEVGVGGGQLHPLAVARTLWIAKASAWMGALVLGWWLGVVLYLLPERDWLRVAERDTPGAAVAVLSALALVIAALWLQHCCEKPEEPPDGYGASND